MTTLTARNGTIEFGPGLPTLLINDQLRVMDQSPEVLAELREGKLDKLLELARTGHQTGTEAVDILIDHPDLDQRGLLPKIAMAVHEEIGCPISLDSRDPEALEGLARLAGDQLFPPIVRSTALTLLASDNRATNPEIPIELEIHPQNEASIRVAQRAGFAFAELRQSCDSCADTDGNVAIYRYAG